MPDLKVFQCVLADYADVDSDECRYLLKWCKAPNLECVLAFIRRCNLTLQPGTCVYPLVAEIIDAVQLGEGLDFILNDAGEMVAGELGFTVDVANTIKPTKMFKSLQRRPRRIDLPLKPDLGKENTTHG